MAKGYIGWLLPRAERDRLLELFEPRYPTVVAHHCTLKFGVDETTPLPRETSAAVVGMADDGQGVQALILSIGGTTSRPDGATYHITWSLKPGRKPVESNKVIENFGWTPVVPAQQIAIKPEFFPFTSAKN